MSEQEMTASVGRPEAMWTGANGIECWKYGGYDNTLVILQNGNVIKTITPIRRRDNFRNLMIGLPEAAVIEMLGRPAQVGENKEGKKISYIIKAGRFRRFHFVRIVNGVVESYGLDNNLRSKPRRGS